jgi:hypothetical protein
MDTKNIQNELMEATHIVKELIHGKPSRNAKGERLNSIAVSRGTLTALYTVLSVCSSEMQAGHELVSRE